MKLLFCTRSRSEKPKQSLFILPEVNFKKMMNKMSLKADWVIQLVRHAHHRHENQVPGSAILITLLNAAFIAFCLDFSHFDYILEYLS